MSAADEVLDLDATGQAETVRRGDIHPRELVEAAMARIDRLDPGINAVIHRQYDRALRDADGPGVAGPFRGVPFLLKDYDCTEAGEPHCAGIEALRVAGFRADADSEIALAFRAAGLIPLGRTNTPELAVMGTTEPAAFGPTRNPWSPDRSPGGSSGGAGAAVAAGYVAAAHATDIAGSIRIPAAHCGLVGLKPTRGRTPTWTVGPPAAMNTQGVITRTVRDSAALLDTIATEPGPGWWAPPPLPGPLVDEVGADPGRLRIGLCTTAFSGSDVDDGCAAAAVDAAAILESLGHDVEESAPDGLTGAELQGAMKTVIATNADAELRVLSAQLGRELGEVDLEPNTWSLIDGARAAGAAGFQGALGIIEERARRSARWWADDGFDLLVTPTTAEPPTLLGQYLSGYRPGRGSAFTRVFNATGNPALSLPLGWPEDGLPRGVQLVAAHGREDLLVRIASTLEEAAPWAHRRPPT